MDDKMSLPNDDVVDLLTTRFRGVPGPRRPSRNPRDAQAAVLVAIFLEGGQLHVILTKRSARMRREAGVVALPGGKSDIGDPDLASTAIRETEEEIGVKVNRNQLIGQLSPLYSRHFIEVVPFVAYIPKPDTYVPCPTEVSHVFHVPLATFLRDEDHRSEEMAWANLQIYMHYFDCPFEHETFSVFGMTAHILIQAASIAFASRPDFALKPAGAPAVDQVIYDRSTKTFVVVEDSTSGVAISTSPSITKQEDVG